MKFGYIVDDSFHAINVFVDRKCGVVVVFQMYEKHSRNVFVNDKVDVVFPVHVDFHTSVVTSFRIVVKAVQKGRVGDAFTDVLLIVDDDIGTNGRGNRPAISFTL